MSGTRSGMCLGDDLPTMHRLCPGTFTQSAGEMETSRVLNCGCDCHIEGTTLHQLIRRGRGAARRS